MAKEMIISVNGREKKIAILDNGYVTEFYIERGDEESSGVVGNIYKGRVQRVLPGMQSAFVGIGLERDAFLYVSDFFDEEEEIERIIQEKSKKLPPEAVEREVSEQIQRARLEREKQMEAVQEIAEPLVEENTKETRENGDSDKAVNRQAERNEVSAEAKNEETANDETVGSGGQEDDSRSRRGRSRRGGGNNRKGGRVDSAKADEQKKRTAVCRNAD